MRGTHSIPGFPEPFFFHYTAFMSHRVAAIIPAAGRSSRMESPKPLLDAGGCSFMARILATLTEGGAEPSLVVVRDLDGPIAAEARAHGGVAVANPDPSSGPVSSLQTGIRALPSHIAAVLFSPGRSPSLLSCHCQNTDQGVPRNRRPAGSTGLRRLARPPRTLPPKPLSRTTRGGPA